MRRAWAVLILWIVSLVAALVTGRDLYYTMTYLFGGTLILSATWAWLGTRGLAFKRYTRSQRAQVGLPFTEHFVIVNRSPLRKLWVTLHDQSDLPGYHASRVINSLGARHEFSWSVQTICEQRGRFRLGPIVLTSSDPLGLFEFRRTFPETESLVVYPATVPIRSFPQPVGYLPGGDALRRRTHYVTTNAAGVREYVPGDSFNRIHWRSTARRGELIVKEFELDPLTDVWIFLDMQRTVHSREPLDEAALATRAREPLWIRAQHLRLLPSTEEYAVTAAASITEYFIRHKRAVGLVSYGQRREVLQADRDERQLGKVLETLAALRAESNIPFDEVLSAEAQHLPRGTTVVAISPSIDPAWIQRVMELDRGGLRFVTILVDGASFGSLYSPRLFQPRLTAMNVPTVLLRNGDDLGETLSGLPGTRTRTFRPIFPSSM
jgi:uncharacterized protein (DUF58 family)